MKLPDMGHPAGKTWKAAFVNTVTGKNFCIALVAAVVGFVVFEALRAKTS